MSKLARRWRNFFRPGNDLFGCVLVALSMVLWFEGKNLRSLNIFMGIVVIFWFTVHLLSKTKLFSKKESDLKTPSLKRKFKLFSFIVVILVALLVLSTGIVINVLEDFGGEPSNHDSPNFKDGVFENLQTTGGQSENGSTWDLLGGYMVSDDCRTPNEELRSEKYEINGLEHDEISITWFGHSTVLIRSNNISIITDPVFNELGAGPLSLGPAPFPYEHSYSVDELPKIDYVFISHDHYDHLDMSTVKELKDSQFLVPLGIKNHLLRWEIDEENVQELDWYDEVNLTEELQVALTPARHFSGRGLEDSHSTLWGSWVFKFHEKSIFFSGDTGFMEEFITIGEKYGPFDIALLDSGQYNTAWHDVHMFPEEVVQAAMDLNASVILPIHISKYELALHHWYEPLEAISQIGGDKNIPVATPLLGSNFIMSEEIPNETWWRGISDCTEPFLDENPMAEYVLFAVGLAGIFLVVVPRVNDRRSILEEE